jgi:hypothetical protein
VGYVGHHVLPLLLRFVQGGRHLVERLSHLDHLVTALYLDPLAQVSSSDSPRRSGQVLQGSGQPAAQEHTEG